MADARRGRGRTEAAGKSEVSDKLAYVHTKGFGHSQKGMEADPLLAAFNLPNIDRVEVGLFRQPLLADAGLGAEIPDRSA